MLKINPTRTRRARRISNEPDTGVLSRRWRTSSPATPASATTSTTTAVKTTAPAALKTAATTVETAARPLDPATTATLEAAAVGPAPKLLAARRTALGKSAGLSPIAGIKGRALCGKVAAPATTAKLRGA